jgi:hypothetical protein
MKTILAFTLLTLTSTYARADEETPQTVRARTQHSLALSAFSSDADLDQRGVAIEGAVSVGGSYSFRALLAVGRSTHEDRLVIDPLTNEAQMYTSGGLETLRVGFEGRTRGTYARVFGGIDIGYEMDHRSFEGMTEYAPALVTAPRIGFEVGRRVYARTALELPLIEHFDGDGPSTATVVSFGVGFGF